MVTFVVHNPLMFILIVPHPRMYRSGEAESLLPVFGTILAFGPDELRSCREGLRALKEGEVPLAGAAAAVDASLSGASSMLSSFSAWVPSSWGGAPGAAAAAPTT